MSEEKKKYVKLQDLEVYKLARELSRKGWEVYEKLDWRQKKILGDQFIESTDSVGANIAEGYGRFHYLDKIKFFYNSRGSLFEASEHWIELMLERDMASEGELKEYKEISEQISIKLQNLISSTYRAKNRKT